MMYNPHDIILNPVQTEKSTGLTEKHRKYAFRVKGNASKIEIKRAVQELFKVNVERVNTISMRGKKKRVRYKEGKTADWKKAIVTLKEGQSIDFA